MTNRKKSLESNQNYYTTALTLIIKEKRENDDNCSLPE